MRPLIKYVLVAIIALFSSNAFAKFTLCNYSSRNVDIAFAFTHPQNPNNWVSAGWKSASSSQCVVLINYNLNQLNSKIYWYAISTNDGAYWAGPQNFCIKRGQPFTIFNSDRNCAAGEWQGFRVVNIPVGRVDYTQQISD